MAKDNKDKLVTDPKAWKGRVRLVTEQWKRKVTFASPQAERAITGTLKQMQGLMDTPMILDGEIQTDDKGNALSRRRFWSMAKAEMALEMIEPEAIEGVTSLEQLADIVYLARYEPPILNQIFKNQDFLLKVAKIRDENGNNLLHWAAAADLPQRLFFSLSGALRDWRDTEGTDPKILAMLQETLVAENAESVKLHEIAYAKKDEGLATELLRAKHSVREANRGGSSFITESLRTDEGAEYLRKLGEIAEEQKLDTGIVKELTVTDDDVKRSHVLSEAERIINNLRFEDGRKFKERLHDAIDNEINSLAMFLEKTPEEAARNRGIFYFGRLDRDGNDWLFYVLQHGDLEMLDKCMTLIERHVRGIADIFSRSRPALNIDDLQRQLIRVYLKTGNRSGRTPMHQAISTKKPIMLQRLLQSGLYSPMTVQNVRDSNRRNEMILRNSSILVGKRIPENLFIHAALVETPEKVEDEDEATRNIIRLLSVLFEFVDNKQGYALFQKIYKIGKPPRTREITFYNYIMRHERILPRVKEAISIYAENYMSPS